MSFVRIDAVAYGATDMAQARRMFLDWGLKKIADRRSGPVFATEPGSEVVVRPDGAPGLRPRIAQTSQFREVIYGVSSRTHLAAIERELSRDREIIRDKDGTLHSVDDSGVNIGFRVWRHGREKVAGGTRWNGPGNLRRVDQVAARYTQASPYKIGHIVFYVPDVRAARLADIRRARTPSDFLGLLLVFQESPGRQHRVFLRPRPGHRSLEAEQLSIESFQRVAPG